MPLYEYRCKTCGAEIEKIVSYDAPNPICPTKDCKTEMKKKLSSNNFHLKGNGWYKDHYGLKKKNAKD